MTTTEFWELYINKNILDIFEVTCAFFSQELPNEFIEDYDVGEVLIETRAKQETAKNFDNVIRFTTIVKENHPDLYLEFFEFFDDFLVDYYCYLGEEDKVREAFAHLTYKDSDNLSGHIQEELSRIGPLADDIREGVAEDKKRWNTATQKIADDGFPHGLPGDKSFVRSERKVGRNDPCPCGSGKKYKKCFGKH